MVARWGNLADFLDDHEGQVVSIEMSLGGEWTNGAKTDAGEFWPVSHLEGPGLSSLYVYPSSSGRRGYKTNARDIADCDRWCGVDALEGRTRVGSVTLSGRYSVEPSYKNSKRTRESLGSDRSGYVYVIRAVE